jgi:sugar O-acyltransferase (sialic acid O-acetyltransferase NeuD family)
MTDYVLVGGGAFAREVHDWFAPVFAGQGDRFAGYIDDNDQPMSAYGRDLRQLGTTDGYQPTPQHRLVMAVAAPKGKQALAEKLTARGGQFASLIHPTTFVAASAQVGLGAVAVPYCIFSANTKTGAFATLNGFVSLGHDVVLDDYVTLSGYVGLMGAVEVGARTFFGAGARVLPKVKIGADCTIGAGAIVMRRAPDGATLYAPPAKRL